MFVNFILIFVILAEIIGISGSQEKILNNPANEKKVLGAQGLPKISIDEIEPLPLGNPQREVTTRAKSALILDLKTNKTLFQKNPSESYPIASITKLMTAVVMEENFNLEEIVTVSSKSASVIGSKMHLYPGEQIKAKELVYGMLIASANDAAKALEEHYGKDKIVEKMNQKAEFLNMKNTHFVEASGLDPENKSNAKDLMILTRYALQNEDISNAIKMKEYTAVSTDGKMQHLIHTTNRLLKIYPDIFGVKTGYTEEAGSCMITGAEQNGHQIISVVLGIDNYEARFAESRKLVDWTFSNFNW